MPKLVSVVWLPDRRPKWLGHSSYVLTLTTYADYIPEAETENPLPETCCRDAARAPTRLADRPGRR